MTQSRRHFLRNLGVSAAALSCTKMGRLVAQDRPPPKRFLAVFTPNGTMPDAWGATGEGTNYAFRRILEPLAPFKEHVVVLEGVDMRSGRNGPGSAHQKGMGSWLTGMELLAGDFKGGCDTCVPAGYASGPSIDQEIANVIGGDTRFRSLELGVLVGNNEDVWTRMSYRGAGQPLPPEQNPARVFERVFGDVGDSRDVEEQRRQSLLRKSVLDIVRSDFATLRARMSSEERQKLDLHETTLRDIEQRLQNPGALGATCRAPVLGEELDARDNDNVPAMGRLQMDMIAMAFACDLTRVASLQWMRATSNALFPWIGVADRHHDLSHFGDSDLAAKEKIIKINIWFAEQFAYLLRRLAEIPEGDGTVLDNTIVLWGNELGKGNNHTRDNIPFVLAGKGGGALRTGRVVRYSDRPHNDLLHTLGRAMGLSIQSFGDPRFNTGVMSELLT